MAKFSSKVREKLGYYVYLYIDPRNEQPFYIGKGKGGRALAHLKSTNTKSGTLRVLEQLKKLGLKPRIEILKYGLSEDQALLVEATAIDLLDVKNLANKVRGHGRRHGTRGSVAEIVAALDARPAKILEKAMLMRISREFRYGMSPQDLYDATRGAWRIGTRREKAEYAIPVYGGIIRQVYRIAKWVPGGSTMRASDADGRHRDEPDRWEFVGKVADEKTCRKYVGKSVTHYFPPRARTSIMYVNC